MSEKKLSEFWEQDVPQQYKHYMGTEFDDKVPNYVKQVKENVLSKLVLDDFSKEDISIDWGVGGGLFSEILAEDSSVIGVDIAQSSLDQATEYMTQKGKKFEKLIKVDELTKAECLKKEKIKLLFCVSVIQHFISFDYWRKVVKLWKEVSPEYIAIQTRNGKDNEDHSDKYFDSEQDYIVGLKLTTDEVKNTFSRDYELVYHNLIGDYTSYEYFIFKRK